MIRLNHYRELTGFNDDHFHFCTLSFIPRFSPLQKNNTSPIIGKCYFNTIHCSSYLIKIPDSKIDHGCTDKHNACPEEMNEPLLANRCFGHIQILHRLFKDIFDDLLVLSHAEYQSIDCKNDAHQENCRSNVPQEKSFRECNTVDQP